MHVILQGKDANTSPARTNKHDKTDSKMSRQISSGKDKYEVQMVALEEGAENGAVHAESYHSAVVDHENIEIVIEPPPEDMESSRLWVISLLWISAHW